MARAGRRYLRVSRIPLTPAPNSVMGSFTFCWIFVVSLLFLFTERATELVEDKGFACERAYLHAGEEEITQLL